MAIDTVQDRIFTGQDLDRLRNAQYYLEILLTRNVVTSEVGVPMFTYPEVNQINAVLAILEDAAIRRRPLVP